jgi:formate transporter FocA
MDERTPAPKPPPAQLVIFDAVMPAAMAARAEEIGVRKATADPVTVLALSILGGAFISLGAIFATTVGTGGGALPFGVARLLSGLAFSLGLVLVVSAGAELFTGNNLIVMAWAGGKVSTRAVLINWALVFAGNFAGAMATVVLSFCSMQYGFADGAVGLTALNTANSKVLHTFSQALVLGIMCNALVCLAIWMSYGARSAVDKIAVVLPPVAAFVAAGFEHCIANIYYIPLGLFIKAGASESFWSAIGKAPTDFPALTWENFLVANLLPVTLGNVLGGSVLVGLVYWFIYLRSSLRHPSG